MFPKDTTPQTERVEFELRSEGIKPGQTNPLRSGIHTRGYLPHVKREGCRYFVTFRLNDSLPPEVFFKIRSQREQRLLRFHAQQRSADEHDAPPPDPADLVSIDRDYHRQMEDYLDRGIGNCWLRRPEIAKLVADALRFFVGQRYQLHAWVVMPNHVHAVLWPMPNFTLSVILKSWKGYTARRINQGLNRTGETLWQPEPFDHWIRDDDEFARCRTYVIRNPVKARLCATPQEWPWSSAHVPTAQT